MHRWLVVLLFASCIIDCDDDSLPRDPPCLGAPCCNVPGCYYDFDLALWSKSEVQELHLVFPWSGVARRSGFSDSLLLFPNLTDLSIRQVELDTIPWGVYRVRRLRHLSLEDMIRPTFLSTEIRQLDSLEVLCIVSTRISSLPPEIGELRRLRYLFLDNNELSVLPPEIGALTVLDSVRLSYNVLTTLPESVRNWTKLRHLDLRHNPIDTTQRAKIRSWLPQATILFDD